MSKEKVKNYWCAILLFSVCWIAFLVWLFIKSPVLFGLLAGGTVLWIAYEMSNATTVPPNEPFLPGDASIIKKEETNQQ